MTSIPTHSPDRTPDQSSDPILTVTPAAAIVRQDDVFTDDDLFDLQVHIARCLNGVSSDDQALKLKGLLVRLELAEDVIRDAENNLGVVNPLLVNGWRAVCKMPETDL